MEKILVLRGLDTIYPSEEPPLLAKYVTESIFIPGGGSKGEIINFLLERIAIPIVSHEVFK